MDALRARSGPAHRSFGPFVLDADRAELRRDGVPVALRPKTHALLAHLVDHAGVVVPKQELIDAVWPGLVVTDDSLTQAISELRAALGDRDQKLIRTLPRRGYLLDVAADRPAPDAVPAPMSAPTPATLPAQLPATPAPPADRLPRWIVPGIAAACGAAAIGLLVIGLAQMPAPPVRLEAELAARQSVAVLPFTDLSEPKAPHLVSAVEVDLITELGRLEALNLISSESTAALAASAGLDARRIGRDFDVRHVLRGSVRREGDGLVVTVQLARTDTGALLWTDRFEYPSLADWSGRGDIAARVAGVLETKVSGAVIEQARRRPPQDNAAVDHWLHGSHLMRNLKTREELMKVRSHLEAALALQPDSVLALAGMGGTHVREVMYRWSKDPPASLATAKALARQALGIDPYNLFALKVLSGAQQFGGELEDAMSTVRRQLELSPRDAHSHRDVAAILQQMGRWDEALRAVDVARRLNPLDHVHLWRCHSIRARVLVVLRRYDEAMQAARLSASYDPAIVTPYLHLAAAEAHRGNLDEAQRHVAEVLRRQPDTTIAKVAASLRSSYPAFNAGMAHYYEGLRLAGLPDGGAR
jgi:DNA-binding winged helix-turn-helix (wHTH) protein/TolB-like protein